MDIHIRMYVRTLQQANVRGFVAISVLSTHLSSGCNSTTNVRVCERTCIRECPSVGGVKLISAGDDIN